MKTKIFSIAISVIIVLTIGLPLMQVNSDTLMLFQKRIDVCVKDKDNNPVSGALVRITGPGFGQCCYTINCLCTFLVDSVGMYQICASKNNLRNDTVINVNNCQLYYRAEPKLIKPGACENCPQERIER